MLQQNIQSQLPKPSSVLGLEEHRSVSRPRVKNLVLAGLPSAVLEMLRPEVSRVRLIAGEVLQERGTQIASVYFIESGLVLLSANTFDTACIAAAMIGREGVVGATVLLGGDTGANHRAVVSVPGSALRMDASALRRAAERWPPLRDASLHCVQAQFMQAIQNAACNARHDASARLANALLTLRDRLEQDDLPVTQGTLSQMLGVRRAGVNVAARGLQSRGIIGQSRGRITISDAEGLAACACGCYGSLRDELCRLRPGGSEAQQPVGNAQAEA